jgi:UTP:GlnB (protein PII) uridylyltransferase
MDTLNNIFQSFITEYNKIYTIDFIKNPNNKFSLKFSLLVQNLILQAFSNHLNSQNILLAIGSFGRRELSPKSDIEIVFIDISDEQAIIIKDISKEIYNNLGLNIKMKII